MFKVIIVNDVVLVSFLLALVVVFLVKLWSRVFVSLLLTLNSYFPNDMFYIKKEVPRPILEVESGDVFSSEKGNNLLSFSSRKSNNLMNIMNKVHERSLRIVSCDNRSFKSLLSMCKEITIYQINLQVLMTETYKIIENFFIYINIKIIYIYKLLYIYIYI